MSSYLLTYEKPYICTEVLRPSLFRPLMVGYLMKGMQLRGSLFYRIRRVIRTAVSVASCS